MAEIKSIIEDKRFHYEGLISLSGLYKAMMKRLDELGYDPREEEHSEEVHETGKQILLKIKGDNKISDFAKIEWETHVHFTHGQQVIVKKGHQDVKMHKGKVAFTTFVNLLTDYDKSFEQNAWLYFLRVVIDKFVFKSYISRAESRAKKDYAQFEQTLKSFLNLENFR